MDLEYPTRFTSIDWVIVAVYLSITIVIGFYVKRYVRDMSHFIVAGRALRSCLAIATMIGTAQMGFTGGFAAFHIALVAGIMTAMLALVLFYTIFGGMISVVITDYIQFVVLSFGLLFVAFLAISHLGWDTIVDTVREIHGEAGFNPFSTEGFGIEYVIFMILMGLWGCSVWQTAVMRACAAESTKVVKRLYTWASVGFLIRMVIPMFLGICALAFIARTPELRDVFLPDDPDKAADSPLGATALAILLMIAGSLLFPDRKRSREET